MKQLNCKKAFACHSFLCREMSLGKYIFLLQEPALSREKLCKFTKNYVSFGENNCRAAIAVHKSYNVWYVPEFSSRDICTIGMNINGKMTYLVSVYCDILLTPISERLQALSNKVTLDKIPVIICADTNAWSSCWNSATENQRGHLMEDWIIEYGFFVHNIGDKDSFVSKIGRSKIDATFSKNGIEIDDWDISEKCTFSDHRLIEFSVNLGSFEEPKAYRNLHKCNLQLFKESLPTVEVRYSEWNTETIDIEFQSIEQAINKALNVSCPFTKTKIGNELPIWWTNDLHNEKVEVAKLFQKACRSNLEADWHSYRDAKKAYTKSVRKCKRSSWVDFCARVESPAQMSKLKKIIERQENKSIGLLKHPAGGYCNSPNDVAKLLLDTHVPGSHEQPLKADNMLDASRKCSEEDLKNPSCIVTAAKIIAAFNSFGPKKASNDNFKPILLRNLNEALIIRLKNLYNACLILQYTPEALRSSKIIFIPKPNRIDYSTTGSWRPITLSSFLFKGLELIVKWELDKTLKSNFSKDQHAFRAGHDVNTALSSLCSQIENSVLQQHFVVACFLDIEGAFPNLGFQPIMNAWHGRNIPSYLCGWYSYYLRNRYVCTDILGVKSRRTITKGLPQGGILSTFSWNLVFDTLLGLFKNGPVSCVGYADDGALLAKGPVLSVLVDIMESALKKAVAWGSDQCLNFSERKTVSMIFSRNLRLTEPRQIQMNGIALPWSTSATYLGIELDQKLDFKLHIQNKIKKAKRFLMMLRNSVGKLWGPSPKALMYAYNNIIIPSLCHGALVWYKACQNTFLKNKLRQLNRLICTALMPMKPSTPSNGLEVVLNLMPLHLKAAEIGLKTYVRVRNIVKPKWQGIGKNGRSRGHYLQCLNDLSNLGICLEEEEEDRTNFLNIDRKFNVDIESKKTGLPIYDNSIKVYSDGSRMKEKTGYGYIISNGDYQIAQSCGYLGKNTSVFQAEVIAIQQACLEIGKMDDVTRSDDITFFTDSMSSVDSFCKLKIKSKVVADCIKELNTLAKDRRVSVRWIRSHSDFTGNMVADDYAKLGVESSNWIRTPVPVGHFKAKIHNALMKEWSKEWRKSSRDFRQTKIFFPDLNSKQSSYLLNLSRKKLGQVIQIISGHNNLNYFENKICKDVNPLCRLCGEEDETAFHLIGECPVLYNSRAKHFQKYLLDDNPEWKVRQLVNMIGGSCIAGMLDGSDKDPEA